MRCERCGAALLVAAGVAVRVDDGALGRLAGFGLTSTGKPLFERTRGRA